MLPVCDILLDAIVPELRTYDPGRHLQLPEPDSAALKRFILTLLMVVLAVLLAAMVRTLRRERLRRAREAKKLEAYLSHRGLSPQERALLSEVVRTAEEPPERVVKLVLCFDRGVDRLLASLPGESGEDRMLRLRRLKSLRKKLELDRVAPGVPLLSSREIQAGQEFLFRLSSNPRGKVRAGVLLESDDAGLLIELMGEGAAQEPGEGAAAGERPSGEVEVYFLRRKDGGYRFRSRLLADVGSGAAAGGKAIWHLSHPRKLSREQRRHHLRIPIHEDVVFALVPAPPHGGPGEEAQLEGLPHDRRGTLLDLSGGGFRMLAEGTPIRPDDLIVLRLPFLDAPLDREIFVARGMKVYRKAAEFGFTFEDLPASAAAAIVRHVEAVHRQLRCVV